jgi:hypothetical protein
MPPAISGFRTFPDWRRLDQSLSDLPCGSDLDDAGIDVDPPPLRSSDPNRKIDSVQRLIRPHRLGSGSSGRPDRTVPTQRFPYCLNELFVRNRLQNDGVDAKIADTFKELLILA